MPLCFIEPQNAIRVIAESVGREARRQILGEVVKAWVDEIPEPELESHYAKAVADLDEHDLSLLAAWHASLEVGHPVPNKEFLVNVFPSLGENRREALKIAASFRGEEAFEPGVGEEEALDTVLPWLSEAALHRACARVPRAVLLGPAGRRQLGPKRRFDLGDCLLGRAEPHRLESELARRGQLTSTSSISSAAGAAIPSRSSVIS